MEKQQKIIISTIGIVLVLATAIVGVIQLNCYKIGDLDGIIEKNELTITKAQFKNVPSINLKSSTISMEITKIANITDGRAYDVYVSGSYAYLADYSDGLKVIDISNPFTPVEVGQYQEGGYAWGVDVSGSYAYVANYHWGLTIINISTPTTPVNVKSIADGGYARDVYVSGDYAYVADYDDGLEIIDISDPTTPVEVGQCNDSGNAYGVFVSGSYAYVADNDDGLEIIDISDPTTPVEVGQYYDGGNAYGVYVSGSYAFVADFDDGLEIIDISDPTTPVEVGQYYDGGNAWSVKVSGSYAYVGDTSNGLEIIDISDPTTPVEVGQFFDGGSARGVFVSESYAYVADYEDGLEILHFTEVENTITITAPINFFSWEIESSHYIYWRSIGYISTVNIELYKNGVFEMTIVSDVSNEGSFYWTLPSGLVNDANYQIKIIDASDSSVYDYSESFEIYTNLIKVTAPNSLFSWEIDSSHYIYWNSTECISTVNIELYINGVFEMAIVSDVSNDGSYYWTLPSGLVNATNYQIKITDASDSSVYDYSDNFEIYTNLITVTAPDSSASWEIGSSHYIYWNSSGYISSVNIELFRNGIFEKTIASSVSNYGSYYWTLPSELGDAMNYQIAVVDASDSSVYDYSEYFEIFFLTLGDDTSNPIIMNAPSDLTVESNYTEQSISWMAKDTNPNTYTIELQGVGIVTGSTTWTSEMAITFNIPDNLTVGIHVYTVNFTDDYGNYIIDNVIFTVEDITTSTTTPATTSVPIIGLMTGFIVFVVLKKKKTP